MVLRHLGHFPSETVHRTLSSSKSPDMGSTYIYTFAMHIVGD